MKKPKKGPSKRLETGARLTKEAEFEDKSGGAPVNEGTIAGSANQIRQHILATLAQIFQDKQTKLFMMATLREDEESAEDTAEFMIVAMKPDVDQAEARTFLDLMLKKMKDTGFYVHGDENRTLN